MTQAMEVDKIAYSSTQADRGFTMKILYLAKPNHGDALVELYRDDAPYRRFIYPAYKIWNLVAHFGDIVGSEINGDCRGYDLAGWNGFGVVMPKPISGADGVFETSVVY